MNPLLLVLLTDPLPLALEGRLLRPLSEAISLLFSQFIRLPLM